MSEQQTTLKEQLYARILEKITQLGFPQDIFLTEGALADEFQASRVSVRETLITLCGDRILKNIPRIGYQIVQLTVHDINDAIRTRQILELGAAEDYLPLLSDSRIQTLLKEVEPSFAVVRKVTPTVQEWWQGNILFHTKLAGLSDNDLMVEMLERTMHILWRANIQFFRNKDPENYLRVNEGSHEAILESLQAKDLARLTENLIRDIDSLKSTFQVL